MVSLLVREGPGAAECCATEAQLVDMPFNRTKERRWERVWKGRASNTGMDGLPVVGPGGVRLHYRRGKAAYLPKGQKRRHDTDVGDRTPCVRGDALFLDGYPAAHQPSPPPTTTHHPPRP